MSFGTGLNLQVNTKGRLGVRERDLTDFEQCFRHTGEFVTHRERGESVSKIITFTAAKKLMVVQTK